MEITMKNRLVNSLATIVVTLFITACGGGGGAGSTGGSYTSTATGKISDTGQTQCYYDYTLDGIYNPLASTCLAPGSAWTPDGQDGYYTINAISFTDNGNGTILDNVTGSSGKSVRSVRVAALVLLSRRRTLAGVRPRANVQIWVPAGVCLQHSSWRGL